MTELETTWTRERVLDANEILDALEEAQDVAANKAKEEAAEKRRKRGG